MRSGIAYGSPQRGEKEQRYVIAVIDLRNRVDACRKTRSAHQGKRGNPTEKGPRAEADGRLLPIDRDVDKAFVRINGMDEFSDPVVWKAGNQTDAALH